LRARTLCVLNSLEEYLQELLLSQDDVDEHSSEQVAKDVAAKLELNFAQAALVLQNSSFVYGRKVEYLYSLVYKALEDIVAGTGGSNKGTGRQRRSPRGIGGGADADVEDFFANLGDNPDFLLLDDVLPEDASENGTKIALPDADREESDANLRASLSSSSTTRLSLATTAGNRTSSSAMGVTTATNATTRMNGSSSTGAVLLSEAAHRALSGTLNSSSLRLADVHSNIDRASGSLLMPGVAPGPRHSRRSDEDSQLRRQVGIGGDVDNDGVFDGNHEYDDGDYGGDDDGGDGGFMAGDDDDDNYGGGPESETRPTPGRAKRVTFADPVPDDPWELLDPHKGDGAPSKGDRPLRIGKTLRLPPGVDQLPSECVTGASTKQSAHQQAWRKTQETTFLSTTSSATSASSLATETFRATVAARKRSFQQHNDVDQSRLPDYSIGLPTVPLQGLAFGEEFAYIAKDSAKRRAAERRASRRQQHLQKQEALAADMADHRGDDYDDHDDDDDGYAFGGHDDNDDDDVYGGGGFSSEDGFQGNTGMASVEDAFEGADAGEFSFLFCIVGRTFIGTVILHFPFFFCTCTADSSDGAQTFEDLCRAHLRAFAKGADKYRSETNLTKRVRHWQDRLAPILEEEERRGIFDIHSYGEALIQKMENEIRRAPKDDDDGKVRTVDFRAVARNLQKHEVCRMFLATLSLCNGGNVGISQPKGEDSGDYSDSLVIELLRSGIDRPMDSYLAPSVAVQGETDMAY